MNTGSRLRRIARSFAAPVAAVVISFIVSSLALLISGSNPLDAYRAMWDYVTTVDSLVAIINRGVPYYVSGLAAAVGFKMGLFNIGVDGQYRLAALVAAAVGAELALPSVLHIAAIMVVAMVVGSAWAGIAGALKVKRGVNEVISTIMLNYIATGAIAYLLSNYLRDTSKTGDLVTKTKELPTTAWLPSLNGALSRIGIDLPEGTVLNGFIVIAAVIGVGFYLLVWRTRFGFDLRSSGINAAAARSAGVSPGGMILRTMLISGAIAGLVGMAPLLSETHKYGDQFPLTLGFTGIAVALLGRNHPAGIALAAFVYAGIERSTQVLSTLGLPAEIAKILQGTLLLSSVIAWEVARRRAESSAVHAAAKARPDAVVSSTPAAEATS
jgi:simple sugar transport system permease protein